ncbi:YajG family lipoprotein [Spiribacter sp. 1M153]|uniref:YajG family lipoprotein n=1 Tax=Spiribacter roseus TaxID=1855875 RepID=UPI00349F75D7
MKRIIRSLVLLGLVSLLAACSQGTQNLRLSPQPPATEPVTDSDRGIALQVVDNRSQSDLGILENPNRSIIRLVAAQDLAYTVQLAAAEGLRGYGFRPTLWDGAGEPRLEIGIETLSHDVAVGVPYELTTRITLDAVAVAGGERFTSQAQTTRTRQRVLPPNAKANAEAVDAAITEALDRLLNAELAAFLADRE